MKPAIVLLLATLVLSSAVAATGPSDVDDDGLTALDELGAWTDPTVADSDGDGLADGAELGDYGTDPLDGDSDGDGLEDGPEVREYASAPLAVDTDDDGLTDGEEVRDYLTNTTVADTDDDGLTDGEEINDHGTDPTWADTDGDSLDDGQELAAGTDPTAADTDDDGLADGPEVLFHDTDPEDADTDDDGFEDGPEVDAGSSPRAADSDGDGFTDVEEVRELDTDPAAADTDDDGLADPVELDTRTDVRDADTDGDGLPDGAEVQLDALSGADPLRWDVFVEVDWMQGERPSRAKLQPVVDAYDDAPIENPDGSTGIDLHVVYSNELPQAGGTDGEDLMDIMDEHMDYEDRGYHYAVAVDTIAREDIGGFTRSWHDNTPVAFKTDAAFGYHYSSGWVQYVFMHELGHALGISGSSYEGVDSEAVPYDTYSSAMNYNDRLGDPQYNEGEPFDDWEHIESNLLTPEVRWDDSE